MILFNNIKPWCVRKIICLGQNTNFVSITSPDFCGRICHCKAFPLFVCIAYFHKQNGPNCQYLWHCQLPFMWIILKLCKTVYFPDDWVNMGLSPNRVPPNLLMHQNCFVFARERLLFGGNPCFQTNPNIALQYISLVPIIYWWSPITFTFVDGQVSHLFLVISHVQLYRFVNIYIYI